MHPFLTQKQTAFRSTIDAFVKDLSALRTGRASPVIVEDIPVQAYGSTMELKGLASIQTQDARTLIVDAWDKNLLQAI